MWRTRKTQVNRINGITWSYLKRYGIALKNFIGLVYNSIGRTLLGDHEKCLSAPYPHRLFEGLRLSCKQIKTAVNNWQWTNLSIDLVPIQLGGHSKAQRLSSDDGTISSICMGGNFRAFYKKILLQRTRPPYWRWRAKKLSL